MKRLLTLATAGLFATGLAVLPVSAFAQSGVTTGADVKTTLPSASVSTGTQAAPASKGAAATGTATITTPKPATPQTSGTAKTTVNGHANGAS